MEIYQTRSGIIRVCTNEEARKLWTDEPEKRPEVWLIEEFDRHILSDSSTVDEIIKKKKDKPGAY